MNSDVRAADGFEFCVALMLIGLGLRAIYLAARQGPAGPVHVHHHGHVSLVVGCVSTTLGVWWGYPLIGRLF